MPDHPDPMFQFSLEVFRVNGLLMRNGEKLTKPAGQSSARWQVLGRAGDDPRSVARMAREMGLARQSVQRVATDLAADGLVVFVADPSDRRAPRVGLTPEGEQALAEILLRYDAWAERMRVVLDAEDVRRATELMASVGDAIERDLEDEEEK